MAKKHAQADGTDPDDRQVAANVSAGISLEGSKRMSGWWSSSLGPVSDDARRDWSIAGHVVGDRRRLAVPSGIPRKEAKPILKKRMGAI